MLLNMLRIIYPKPAVIVDLSVRVVFLVRNGFTLVLLIYEAELKRAF